MAHSPWSSSSPSRASAATTTPTTTGVHGMQVAARRQQSTSEPREHSHHATLDREEGAEEGRRRTARELALSLDLRARLGKLKRMALEPPRDQPGDDSRQSRDGAARP